VSGPISFFSFTISMLSRYIYMYWSLTPSSILYHITQLASSCPLLSNTPQDKSSSLALLQHSYQNRLKKYCNQPHCVAFHICHPVVREHS
jgi:hypothetical protein